MRSTVTFLKLARIELYTTIRPPALTITNPFLWSATSGVLGPGSQHPITSPAVSGGIVAKPYLQLQGFANEQLASIAYDISNATGLFTNQDISMIDRNYDTNKLDFTTNYFQAYDVPLAPNENFITLRVTDRAGNTATTNKIKSIHEHIR